MSAVSKAAVATKLSWIRAGRLHDLINNEDAKSSDCRAYLATMNGQATILDSGKDGRTPGIRALIKGFDEWYAAGGRHTYGKSRKSKGDPSKSPRAGAPTERANKPGPKPGRRKGGIDFSGLEALRSLQRKHGLRNKDIIEYSLVLAMILDEELDLAQIQREFKQSLKS